MKILVLNSGSSSQKSSLYEVGDSLPQNPPIPAWEGKIEWEGEHAKIAIRNSRGTNLERRIEAGSHKEATEQLLAALWSGDASVISSPADVATVGHRVVHGGSDYLKPTVITPAVRESLARLSIFAPLHNRGELDGVSIVERQLGNVPQIAVFDTAFHSQMPPEAYVYPGPYDWLQRDIRRYGFHGINHQYCAERTAQLLGKHLRSLKIVSCHLGNGCSLAAIQNGHSVDTTMGFTPLEGLMMGTRSGSVDPGIITHLIRTDHSNADDIDELLNTKSGLLGISGVSSDMRLTIVAMNQGNPRAKLAFNMFVHRLRRGIGAMIAVLGGIDALVFTAGIGENSPQVRAGACECLNYLRLELDAEKNTSAPEDREISTSDSAVRVLVIHAREDWAIARECWRFFSATPKNHASALPH